MKQVELYKLLSDENRLKIFTLLLHYELCICDLELNLKMKQANVSKHMMKFKNLNIVEIRKDAQWVYYKLSDWFIKDNQYLVQYIKDKAFKNNEIKQLIEMLKVKKACKK